MVWGIAWYFIVLGALVFIAVVFVAYWVSKRVDLFCNVLARALLKGVGEALTPEEEKTKQLAEAIYLVFVLALIF